MVSRLLESLAVAGVLCAHTGGDWGKDTAGIMGGKLDAPVVRDAVAHVVAAAGKHNIPVGGPAGSAAQIKSMISQGYRFLQGPSGLSLLQVAARYFFANLKKEGVERKGTHPAVLRAIK